MIEDYLPTTELFLKGIQINKKITRTYGKAKAGERRKKELLLGQKVVEAQMILEVDPQSQVNQAMLLEVEEELKMYLDQKSRWMLETAQLKW